MFVEVTETATGKKITLNFSHVEYFKEVSTHDEAYTLIVFRGLDEATDDGMNRYCVRETPAEILAALAGGRDAA